MQGHKKRRYGILINVGLIAGILIVVNFLSCDYFSRLDLTEGKSYSVTSSTKNVLKKLDDIISVKVYCSKKMPTHIEPLTQELKDTLQEYQAYSHGKLQVEWIDPADDKETEEKVRRLGIHQAMATSIEKDKQESVRIYLGLGIFYADRKEIIPVIQDMSNFEYDLTSSILKVMSGKLKKIAFLTGHNEHDISKDYSILNSALGKSYDVTTIDTRTGNPIPDDVDTLVVAGPTEITERDKYEIDQFLMKGKNVFFFVDSMDIPTETLQANIKNHQLDNLLGHYGVRVKKDIVLDMGSRVMVPFSTNFGTFVTNYSPWPKVVHQYMASNLPIVSRIETVAFPWPSSIEIIKEATSGMETVELLKTTEYAWVQEGNFNLDPQGIPSPPRSQLKQYTLAAIIRGKFRSFFADRPIPAPKATDNSNPVPADKDRQTIKECVKPGTILVTGDSDFIANKINEILSRREGDNMSFIMNAFDWATLGNDLIGIRAKEICPRLIGETSSATKLFVKVLNIGLVPLLFIIYGLLRFFLKQRDRKLVDELS